MSSLGNKHKHKIIFVLLVILCVAVNIHFTPLSLPAEDFVTVGYTTTLFSQTHSFKDLVLNYHYPHGSVLVLSLLYYPFYHTGLWFTVHAYLPLLVHLGLFLVFHSFCFNHARRYYVLLDLWFIFPSFMFITFLRLLASQHEALLVNAATAVLFVGLLKAASRRKVIGLAVFCAFAIFIEISSLILVLAMAATLVLASNIARRKRLLFGGAVLISAAGSLAIQKAIETFQAQNGVFLMHPITTGMSKLFSMSTGDASSVLTNLGELLVMRIPRLFLYLPDESYVLFMGLFVPLAAAIIIHTLRSASSGRTGPGPNQRGHVARSIAFFFMFMIAIHLAVMSLYGVDTKIDAGVYATFFSRHEANLLIPGFLLLVLGGLMSGQARLRTASLLFIALMTIAGIHNYLEIYDTYSMVNRRIAAEVSEYRWLARQLQSYRDRNHICGFHTTTNLKQTFTFLSKGQLLLDCKLHQQCPWASDHYENRTETECAGQRIGYVVPSHVVSPETMEHAVFEPALDRLKAEQGVAIFGLAEWRYDAPGSHPAYVFYTESGGRNPREAEIIHTFKQIYDF